MLSKVLSSSVIGVDAYRIDVEVDVSSGLPVFTIVGLPEAAVKESKERVKSAIRNSGYTFPMDRITVNLAPADIKKEGTGFDLPIALGVLAASGAIPQDMFKTHSVMGELSLDGSVKGVRGSLPAAIMSKDEGLKGVVLPKDNGREASVVQDLTILPARHLSEVVDFFRGFDTISPLPPVPLDEMNTAACDEGADFCEVMGQAHVKRALEIAAAGFHNVLMIGPPGSGKTMLARRLPTILPPMTFAESIETTKIYSVSGKLDTGTALVSKRPFRSPHHTISDAGLIGGGHMPKPGEISLAHNGVLFLDEFPEFRKNVLEALRQPMEDHHVTVSRAATAISYPSSFMLIAAMNPCPCGYLTDQNRECTCSFTQIRKYRTRLSGPLLDRIDIHVEVPAVPYGCLVQDAREESSKRIRERVVHARTIQKDRFKRSRTPANARMTGRQIKTYCRLDDTGSHMLLAAMERLGLSARAYNRILKISRTIADLGGEKDIRSEHVMEAIQYRSLDRDGKTV